MNAADSKSMSPSPKAGDGVLATLSDLVNTAWTQGPEEAGNALNRYLAPEARSDSYYEVPPVDTADSSTSATRLDVDEDGFAYWHYGPRNSWEPPYVVVKVRVSREKPDVINKFMTHAGEELLTPTLGSIVYSFFWHGTGTHAKKQVGPQRWDRRPVMVGQLCRINPQIPHHNYSVEGVAEAWMVLRPISGSGTSVVLRTHKREDGTSVKKKRRKQEEGGSTDHVRNREVPADNLKDPGIYGLVASGLWEKFRLYRSRCGLTLAELAQRCELDMYYLSKLEGIARRESTATKAPVSFALKNLERIAEVLDVTLEDIASSWSWTDRVKNLQKLDANELSPASHFLHPTYLQLKKGSASVVIKPPSSGIDNMCSWIVLSGQVAVTVTPEGPGTAKSVEFMLGEGRVLHVRHNPTVEIASPFRDASLLQIQYSSVCSCHGESGRETGQ
jgi:transcriptional regulator with XRE-family HTH domain